MTVREAETLDKKKKLIDENWAQYCATRSPWFFRQWGEAKKKYYAYRDKLRDKYQGQQLTF